MSEAIDNASRKYNQFLEVVELKINSAIAEGKSLPATKLAKDVGPTFGWEWPQAYHIINSYLDERQDLFVKKGPNGGISLKPVEVMSGSEDDPSASG